MKLLDTSIWKEYKIGDLFDIRSSAKKFNANAVTFGGGHPYVARGTSDNGIRGYIDEDEQYLNPGNTFSFGQDTATIYYQDKPYFTGDKIKIFSLKNKKLNDKIAQFLISSIRKGFANYSWGQTSFNEEALKNTIIKLPATPDGQPDWAYMEKCIAELEEGHLAELEAYLISTGLNDYELTDEDKKTLAATPEWGEFKLEILFECDKGDVDLQQKDINGKGEIFINSGETNLGIKGRTDRLAKIFPANTITIDFWGLAYYRDFEYKMATHNHVFSLSGDVIKNKEVGLFIVSQMAKFPTHFSYNNMATWNKLKDMIIQLPILPDGTPDFEYMEKYTRAMEKTVIADVVRYKDKVIEETKKVVGE